MTANYKIASKIAKFLCAFMFRVRCEGLKNVPPNGAFMLCSNHTSLTDIFLLLAYCPRQIHFMAKAELFKIPLVGAVVSSLGAFPVNRGASDIGAVKRAVKTISGGKVLGIFPEGTRYRSGAPREFKTGVGLIAAKTGADILPCAIYKEKGTHPFRRVTLRFGSIIKHSDAENTPKKEHLKLITQKIQSEVTALWEMKF